MSGKQCRPWSDAAFCGVWSEKAASDLGLYCLPRSVCSNTSNACFGHWVVKKEDKALPLHKQNMNKKHINFKLVQSDLPLFPLNFELNSWSSKPLSRKIYICRRHCNVQFSWKQSLAFLSSPSRGRLAWNTKSYRKGMGSSKGGAERVG